MRHDLDFNKTLEFFSESLSDVNRLSDAILCSCDFKLGRFYTFLPKEISFESLHDFKYGGKSNPLRKYFSGVIGKDLSKNCNLVALFDDFNSSWPDIEKDKDEAYLQYGQHFGREVYYLLKEAPSSELVLKFLRRSTTLWHSLCVISECAYDPLNKELSEACIQKICKGCRFVYISAYDEESYVFWESSGITEIEYENNA